MIPISPFITFVYKLFTYTITFRIITFPSFIIETLCALMALLINTLLVVEIASWKPLFRGFGPGLRESNALALQGRFSRSSILSNKRCKYRSIPKEVFRLNPSQSLFRTCVDVTPQFSRESLSINPDKVVLRTSPSEFSNRIDLLLKVSPSEYIRQDRQQQIVNIPLDDLLNQMNQMEGSNTPSNEHLQRSINSLKEHFDKTKIIPSNTKFTLPSRNSLRVLLDECDHKITSERPNTPSIFEVVDAARKQSKQIFDEELDDDVKIGECDDVLN